MADIMRLTQGKRCTISERKRLILVPTEDFFCSLAEHLIDVVAEEQTSRA
jgi:hypothetical protein